MTVKKRTILYAPAWENDNKQDDFVREMLKLDVNILIKQAHFAPDYSPEYKEAYEEVIKMYNLHKDIKGVTILDPKTNIFDAIMACDVLVSEESSTMCEAAMMGVPAVSVSDWLIPDVKPHRLPVCNYDFVIMTKKSELSQCVAGLLKDYSTTVKNVERFRVNSLGEIGGCSQKIMDIIDDCVEKKKIRYNCLEPSKRQRVPFNKIVFHIVEGTKRELYHNYNKRYKIVHVIYEPTRKIKKRVENMIKSRRK